jgi:PIN domain nuclease of toxin-antitoxin system
LVSVISFWEISLKHSIGKLKIEGFAPEDLPGFCTRIGFDILDLDARISSTYHQLQPLHHRDQFDRMLIWTAINHNLVLVSADKTIKQYASIGLRVL